MILIDLCLLQHVQHFMSPWLAFIACEHQDECHKDMHIFRRILKVIPEDLDLIPQVFNRSILIDIHPDEPYNCWIRQDLQSQVLDLLQLSPDCTRIAPSFLDEAMGAIQPRVHNHVEGLAHGLKLLTLEDQ